MSTFKFTSPEAFPVGASVSVYETSEFATSSPTIPATETQTVDNLGYLTFTTLRAGAEYVAFCAATQRKVEFQVPISRGPVSTDGAGNLIGPDGVTILAATPADVLAARSALRVEKYVTSTVSPTVKLFDFAAGMADSGSSGLILDIPDDGIAYRPNSPNPILLNANDLYTRFRIGGGGRLDLPQGMASGASLLYRNRNADGSPITGAQFGRHPRVIIEDLKISGYGSPNGTFLSAYNSGVSLTNVSFENLKNGVLLDGYSDQCNFDGVTGDTMTSGGWVVQSVAPGDGWTISHCRFYGCAGFSLLKQNGVVINGLIGGWHEFTECDVELGGLHIEGDTTPPGSIHSNPLITSKGSRLFVKSGELYTNVARPAAVVIDDNDGAGERHSSVTFGKELYFQQRLDASGSTVGNRLGVAVYIQNPAKRTTIAFQGGGTQRSFRQDSTGADIGFTHYAPSVSTPNVKTDEIAILTAINARPAMLATDCELRRRNGLWEVTTPDPMSGMRTQRRVTATGSNGAGSILFTPAAADPAPVNGSTWSPLPAATYYYKAWTRDLETGTTIAVEPGGVAVTAGQSVKMTVDTFHAPVALRILRGTAPGTFDRWVEILLAREYAVLWDQFDAIAGVAWSGPTGLPGAPSTNTTYDGFVVRGTGKQQIWCDAIPSSVDRAFNQGDAASLRTVSAGGSPGSICVASGSPGTWKALPSVAA